MIDPGHVAGESIRGRLWRRIPRHIRHEIPPVHAVFPHIEENEDLARRPLRASKLRKLGINHVTVGKGPTAICTDRAILWAGGKTTDIDVHGHRADARPGHTANGDRRVIRRTLIERW